MNDKTIPETPQADPAVGAQLVREVRPCAWVDAGSMRWLAEKPETRSCGTELFGAQQEGQLPLYDQAAVDAVAAGAAVYKDLWHEADGDRVGLRAVVAEFVAAYDEYNGAIGLNGTQAENEALLYRVTYRHGAAWKALRGLVGPNVRCEPVTTAKEKQR